MTSKTPTRTAPAKVGVSLRVPKCDYCGTLLKTVKGSTWDRGYWLLDAGFRACDECLAENADDFPDYTGWQRILALRLLHVHGVDLAMLDRTVEQAREVIIEAQVRNAVEFRRTTFKLFEDGERLVAMSSGQAYWNAVNMLYGAIANRSEILAGRALIEARKKPRKPELQAWIGKQLEQGSETARELWNRAPERFKDEIGFDRFVKRVTAARKAIQNGRK